MKTAFRIFGVITLLVAMLFCTLSIYRTAKDGQEAETELTEARAQLKTYHDQAASVGGEAETYMKEQVAGIEKQIDEAPSGTTYTIVLVLLSALLIAALVSGVLLFRTNLPLSQKLLIGSVALLLAAYFVSPDIARGPYGGMENRTLALMSGIPAILTALFAFLTARKTVSEV